MLASPCIITQFKQINQLDATVSQVYYLLLVAVWPAGQTATNNAATTNAPTVKPEAVNAVVSS